MADFAGVYSDSAPDLFDGLANVVTTAAAFNDERATIHQALMAAVGFGNTGAEIFERGGPYLVRGAEDLLPSTKFGLDYYSPELLCAVRNIHDVAPNSPRCWVVTATR